MVRSLALQQRTNDRVLISNCRSGARFETYIFRGEPGSGAIELNGAAAHLVEVGDQIIVMHFAMMTDEEYREHRPKVAIVTAENALDRVLRYEPHGIG